MQQNTNSATTLHIDNYLVWLCCTSGKIRCEKPMPCLCLLPHIRDKLQKPAKNYNQKIRQIDVYATVSQVLNINHLKTGNGNDINQLKITLKNL